MGMELPREIYNTWKAVADKFSHLHKSRDDDDRRLATRFGVQTIRARHKGVGVLDGKRYVCKTEHSNLAAQSKDTLGFVPIEEGVVEHGRLVNMHMFDMINGTTRETNAHPVHSHNFEELPPNPDGYILLMWPEGDAYDWLEGIVPVEPEPDKPDTEPEKDIEGWLTTVESRVAKTEQRLEKLENNNGESDEEIEAVLKRFITDIIQNHLEVEVAAEQAGPTVKVPFMGMVDLKHKHSIVTTIKLFGKVVRSVRLAEPPKLEQQVTE